MSTVSATPEAAGAPRSHDVPGALLEISGLAVSYARRVSARRHPRTSRVLSGVDLSVARGEILGIIGETGSGKTTLARATVGLLRPEAGRVVFAGRELNRLRGRELRAFRRSGQVQYMFQDPLRSLDPALTVRQAVGEPLAVAGAPGRDERAERVEEALGLVGLDAGELAGRTPGLISGGQRQRVALARALVTRPRLLLTDEPVSALDASNRNLVLSLLAGLRRELGLSVVVISHDLGSLAGVADRIAVLYRGRLVEEGPARDVLERPAHPYTALLTASAPSVRPSRRTLSAARLRLPDDGRDPWPDGRGCVFAPRCRFAVSACGEEPVRAPAVGTNADGAEAVGSSGSRPHTVACHRAPGWRDGLRTP